MTLLEVSGLVAGYGGVPVLHEVDLRIDEGELLTVLGANGAGKSTLMRTIAGLGHPMSGTIVFAGVNVARKSARVVTRMGIAHVPENRRIFAQHAVEENLMLGGYIRRDRKAMHSDADRLYEQFPILEERRAKPAGTLSGGEQQMLAIAMALMARPRLLMLDEPSLGLGPIIVQRVFEEIELLRSAGTTILLNEQLVHRALSVADRGMVLHLGRVVAAGSPSELLSDESIRGAYLGT